jgi:threonine dehydrogenase-like Zn-dependent dehydrogenase
MRAVIFDGSTVAVGERPEPEPAPGMAVVAVKLAGVCSTDLEIARGYMGFTGVLGHELAGVVVEGPDAWRGRRVVCEINFACGRCERCRQGLSRHCATRRVMGILGADGAFAQRVAVPVANLHAIPDSVRDEEAVFCEPLAAAFEILEQLALDPSEWREQRVLVLGDGKLGLLVAQVLHGAGARVLVAGRHPEKLRLLAARGIETTLASEHRSDGAPRFDVTVEATGSTAGFEAAVASTRPRGTLVLKSTVAGRHALDLAPVVIDEIRVQGSRCGPFEPALEALAARRVEVASLVSERFSLARGDDAIRHAARPGVLKVLIDCAG